MKTSGSALPGLWQEGLPFSIPLLPLPSSGGDDRTPERTVGQDSMQCYDRSPSNSAWRVILNASYDYFLLVQLHKEVLWALQKCTLRCHLQALTPFC